MVNIDDTLVALDFKALYVMAEWHDRQANILRARAHRLENRVTEDRNIDRRLKFLEQLPRMVSKYLRQGHPLESAIGFVARDTDSPVGTVQHYWKGFLSEKNGQSMAARNRLIMDLAVLGLKNAQIGERVGMHANSVSRIISQERKKRLVFDRSQHPELLEMISDRLEKPPAGNVMAFEKRA